MERYSNSTREVAQDGRRGALMLTISIKHPDAENFIDAKLEKGKVTGANVSVRIDDEFMRCALSGKPYVQKYPIDSDHPKFSKEIDASALWKKIIHNAWQSAEPGVLFWDTRGPGLQDHQHQPLRRDSPLPVRFLQTDCRKPLFLRQ